MTTPSSSEILNNTVQPLLLETDPTQAIIYTVAALITGVLGVVSNIIIILVFLGNKKLRKSRNYFIVNLAVADFMVLLISNSLCVVAVLVDTQYVESSLWIRILDGLCLVSCFSSLINQTALALSRYIQLNHTYLLNSDSNKRFYISTCLSIWILCAVVGLGNFLSWGYPTFGLIVASCLSDKIKVGAHFMAYVSMGFVLCCFVFILFFYTSIFKTIYQSKRKIFSANVIPEGQYSTIWVEVAKTSRALFLIFIAFIVCWIPYAVVVLVDLTYQLSTTVHLWITWWSHVHSSINIFIHFFAYRSFRKGLKMLFRIHRYKH